MTGVEQVGNTVNVAAWHPEFQQTLDAAFEELQAAHRALGENPGMNGRDTALEATRRAEDHLGYLLTQWEDVPEPALDALKGVLFETRDMMKVLQDGGRGYGLLPGANLQQRLQGAMQGIEAIDDHR